MKLLTEVQANEVFQPVISELVNIFGHCIDVFLSK